MALPHEPITPIPNNEPDAVPSLWNERYAEINTNFQNLDDRLSAQEAELQASRLGKESLSAAVSAIVEQMGGITGTIDQLASPIHMQKAMRLDLKYREKCMEIEMFVRGYNLSEAVDIPVLHGVKGDDSIDVENTADLEIGHHYLLQAGDEVRLIQISRILSKSRMRFYGNLSQHLDGTGRITSMTFTPRAGNMGGALASVGARWVSKRVHLGDDERMRLAVIRCRKNEGDLKLSFIDEHHDTWQPCAWTYKRDSRFDARIPEGFVDIEYMIPMRGMGQLSLEVVGEDAEIAHMVFLGNVRSLGIGVRNPALPPALASEDADLPPAVAHALAQIERAANQAQATATQAQNIANQALEQAQSAENTANQASEQAQSAQNTQNQNDQATSEHSAPVLSVQKSENQIVFINQTVDAIPTRTVWQVKREGASWDEGLLIDEMSSEKKFRYEFQKDAFSLNGMDAFVARSRFLYGGKYTAWSNELSLSIDQLETADGIIGVGLDVYRSTAFSSRNAYLNYFNEEKNSPWRHIDSSLNVLNLQDAERYFNNHPIYKNIVEQVIDGDHMIKIPKFYIKKYWADGRRKFYFLISPTPKEGFDLHPAFYHDGEEKDCFWVGKYMASATTHNQSSLTYDMPHKLRSLPAMRPLLLQTPDEGQEFAQYERGAIANLYGIWHIHQLEAIKLLMLIEGAHANYLAKYVDGGSTDLDVDWNSTMKGQDTPSIPNVDDEKIAADSWRGIVGLWSSLGQWVYGIGMVIETSNTHVIHHNTMKFKLLNPKKTGDDNFITLSNQKSFNDYLFMESNNYLGAMNDVIFWLKNKEGTNNQYIHNQTYNHNHLDLHRLGQNIFPKFNNFDFWDKDFYTSSHVNDTLNEHPYLINLLNSKLSSFSQKYLHSNRHPNNKHSWLEFLKQTTSLSSITLPVKKAFVSWHLNEYRINEHKVNSLEFRYAINFDFASARFGYLHGASSAFFNDLSTENVKQGKFKTPGYDATFGAGMWSFWLMPLETKAVYAAENHDKPYAAHGAPTRIMKY